MHDALESKWQDHVQAFIDRTAADFSAWVDETLDEIFSDSEWYEPHKITEGMGAVTLSVVERSTGGITDYWDMQDTDADWEAGETTEADVRTRVHEFLNELEGPIGHHDPFPAEYRGKYA